VRRTGRGRNYCCRGEKRCRALETASEAWNGKMTRKKYAHLPDTTTSAVPISAFSAYSLPIKRLISCTDSSKAERATVLEHPSRDHFEVRYRDQYERDNVMRLKVRAEGNAMVLEMRKFEEFVRFLAFVQLVEG